MQNKGDFMFIERLDQLLAEKRISQNQLIETCGIGKNQFAYWRKNHNIPSGKVLDKIANHLGVSVDYLLGKTDEKDALIADKEIFEYSGKFTVRVSPYVHKQASKLADQLGISLNQYINDAIVTQNATLISKIIE